MDPHRDVYALMGLPFDALGMEDAVDRIRQCAITGRRLFVSTPNLNFLVSARGDADFRASVLHSDLSLADGMPLVWVARLLGVPVRERVSGASLFEQLGKHGGEPVTVYFFGGPDGAAEAACHRVNEAGGGLRCVGFASPGFASVEDISTEAHIDHINRSGAMFVVVSLGAKKGQRWIETNLHRIHAPVLCHLGAVVNFAAGTVQRAPRAVQALGFEWLWRIWQEPSLWRRYWNDGLAFLAILITEVLPLWWSRRGGPRERSSTRPSFEAIQTPGPTRLVLRGHWAGGSVAELRHAVCAAMESQSDLIIDLAQTEEVGSAALGVFLQAAGACVREGQLSIVGVSPRVRASFHRWGCDFLIA